MSDLSTAVLIAFSAIVLHALLGVASVLAVMAYEKRCHRAPMDREAVR